MSYNTKPPIVTEVSHKGTFDILRKIFRWALESGRTDDIGLDRTVIWALPAGGKIPQRTRSAFSDDTAKALADPANLELLAAADTTDRGRPRHLGNDHATGRRASEVLELRLDCIAIHNGIPKLRHDQTKVENTNEAIRIPERVYRRLNERRSKTLANFERRYGRRPTAEERPRMALFPRKYKNPTRAAFRDPSVVQQTLPGMGRRTRARRRGSAPGTTHSGDQTLGPPAPACTTSRSSSDTSPRE